MKVIIESERYPTRCVTVDVDLALHTYGSSHPSFQTLSTLDADNKPSPDVMLGKIAMGALCYQASSMVAALLIAKYCIYILASYFILHIHLVCYLLFCPSPRCLYLYVVLPTPLSRLSTS